MSKSTSGKVAVVLGARGGTGRQIVRRLAEYAPTSASTISEIRAIVRDASVVNSSMFPSDDRIKVISGDVTKMETLKDAFEGAAYVFNATSGSHSGKADVVAAVDRDGVGATAELAAEVCGDVLERYLLVSSQLVHPSNRWHPVRVMLNNIATGPFAKKGLMDLKWEGEEELRRVSRERGVPYTIVRPGRLDDSERGSSGGRAIVVGQTNGSFGSHEAMGRADLAEVCVVAAVAADGARDTSFETAMEAADEKSCKGEEVGGEGLPPVTEELFAGLKPRFLDEVRN